ncbi:hypothetical protein A3B21_04400 [Candidatus Uhrbacteria bacterium RIFCSPLOWO2_01_FULL_47_24]|uniref:Uncharacterized protein n=1 Tax=Candidatus Uhrbacteria bacterium RIFCSPLOWO2_01_FULL_47_24 TaxID=1802401 RepID=A0A1F7UVA0_9BACT|nr:MAG: hypothetical protein A2753_01050 [Candidatus Uhrbacteria bacterium RIFCSPHIGHO2_01_FULL_47_11]OGL68960.1 MAG: hypothetical protein A3D58_00460 [Candidatus Uhrbacteria bacterium RIFCSPHIGHO2_02_FULL_46_47]OGL74923.1 MAG: hypothetical protein A3F52_02045 [Candidatus Uhrbacteria bacterium RIFCSPHIGHO2_12_FULL_47_11]OGL81664.1 MAG: hypothetical protein A3B21_04400 [Candidatus Uhrbacteria bacterium RIFCSPLOWO2_01_FULL_47_24]OGL85083.1 MAG: hypothetical protein A3J03_03915 [Candidatus Uhrbact
MQKKQIVLIIQTILALALTQCFVLLAMRVASTVMLPTVSVPALSARQFLLTFLAATVLILFLIRALRTRFIFESIFILSLLSGIWFLFALWIPAYAFSAALILVALRYIFPYVIVQNVLLIFGIAGIGSALGSTTAWQTTLIVLLVLAVYDVIAVYGTKHMVTMFKGLLAKGVIFAIIIPEHPRLMLKRMKQVEPGEGFFFLGTGDLALPSFFVASAARESFTLAIGAAIGSIVGLFFTDLLFQWGRKRPMPALPSIAFGTIAGFFITKLFV